MIRDRASSVAKPEGVVKIFSPYPPLYTETHASMKNR